MKLYVWEGVLCDYTCGGAFVLAEDEAQAWALLKEKYPTEYSVISGKLNEEPKSPRVVEMPEAFAVWGSA